MSNKKCIGLNGNKCNEKSEGKSPLCKKHNKALDDKFAAMDKREEDSRYGKPQE